MEVVPIAAVAFFVVELAPLIVGAQMTIANWLLSSGETRARRLQRGRTTLHEHLQFFT